MRKKLDKETSKMFANAIVKFMFFGFFVGFITGILAKSSIEILK